MNRYLQFLKMVILILMLAVIAALGVTVGFQEAWAESDTDTGVGDEPVPVATMPPVSIYISSSSPGTVDGVRYDNEDILRYDYESDRWFMFFDGSICGLRRVDIEAFDITPPDVDGVRYLVMAFDLPIWIRGLGRVDDSDIVRYLGDCKFDLYFDGSEHGLTRDTENINGIAFMPDGNLLLTTNGYVGVPGLATGTFRGRGQDLWIYDFATEKYTFYFDGSDVDLTHRNEIIDGIWVDDVPGHDRNIYLGTFVDFTAVGSTTSVAGDTDDIFGCFPLATGDTTDCYFFPFFDNDAAHFPTSMDDFYVDFIGELDVVGAAGPQAIDDYFAEPEPEYEGYDPGGPDVDFDDTELFDGDGNVYLPLITR